MSGSGRYSTPGWAWTPAGASAIPAARSIALHPVLLRIGPISSMTYGASPAGPRRVPPGRERTATAVAAPARRRSSVLLEGPDNIAVAVAVKPGFAVFAAPVTLPDLPPIRRATRSDRSLVFRQVSAKKSS